MHSSKLTVMAIVSFLATVNAAAAGKLQSLVLKTAQIVHHNHRMSYEGVILIALILVTRTVAQSSPQKLISAFHDRPIHC